MHEPSPDPGGMTLRPVGIIRSAIPEPFLVADRDGIAMREGRDASMNHIQSTSRAVSELVIDAGRIGVLDGIEEYSHITVVYWGHRIPEESRSLTHVHPMGRTDIPKVGIYATCSPARPNPVLVTVVRLHARRGNVLEVAGLDAVDGSPIIDIKPYVPAQIPAGEVRVPAWMDMLMQEVGERRA